MHTVFIPHTKHGTRIGKAVFQTIVSAAHAVRQNAGNAEVYPAKSDSSQNPDIYWVQRRDNFAMIGYVEAVKICP